MVFSIENKYSELRAIEKELRELPPNLSVLKRHIRLYGGSPKWEATRRYGHSLGDPARFDVLISKVAAIKNLPGDGTERERFLDGLLTYLAEEKDDRLDVSEAKKGVPFASEIVALPAVSANYVLKLATQGLVKQQKKRDAALPRAQVKLDMKSRDEAIRFLSQFPGFEKLTEQQLKVLELENRSLSVMEIAAVMGLDHATVIKHLDYAKKKLKNSRENRRRKHSSGNEEEDGRIQDLDLSYESLDALCDAEFAEKKTHD